MKINPTRKRVRDNEVKSYEGSRGIDRLNEKEDIVCTNPKASSRERHEINTNEYMDMCFF